MSDIKNQFYNSTPKTASISDSTKNMFYSSVDPKRKESRYIAPTYAQGLGEHAINTSDYSKYFSAGVFDQPGLDDNRARNQSAAEQIWNGAIRLVGTAGTKAMSGVGYIGGFLGYAGSGFQDISKMTDNGFSAYFDGLESSLKQSTPIYKPSWVTNGGFWDHAKSLSWWMDDGVDGAAYLASSLLTGYATKGLQLGSNIAKIIGAGSKIAEGVDMATITALSTISEAAQEAHGVQQQVRGDLATLVKNGKMTQQQAELKAAEAARNDFLLNGLILLGPNALESKWFFGNASKVAEKSVLNKIVDESGALVADTGPVTRRLVAKKLLKNAGIGIATEGLWEENAQLAAQNMTSNAAEGKGENSFNQFFSNMKDNFGTTDGKMSIFLGALMGGVGGATGGIREGIAEKKAITKAQSHLSSVNSTYTANLKNTIKDIYEKEVDENGVESFKKDTQGNLILNKDKATEVFDKLKSKRDIETLKQVALLTNQKDMFETLQNISFSNLAIEHLMYGDGSLEVLNQRIDSMAEENKKEYEDIFGMLGEDGTKSIDKMKEQQKSIAKVIDNSLTREKDYAGVWDTPEFKNKEELKKYDNFVQNMIGNKALADARIAFANQKISDTKEKLTETKTKVDSLKSNSITLNGQLSTLEDMKKILNKKNLTEDEQSLKDSYGKNISKRDLDKEIKNIQRELDDTKEQLDPLEYQLDTHEKKIDELTTARDQLKTEYGNLTNTSLKNKIQEEWKNTKDLEQKAVENQKIQAEEKAKQEEQTTNSTSNGKGATTRTIDALEKELTDKMNAYQQMAPYLEENDPQLEGLFNDIQNLKSKIDSMKVGTTAQETNPSVAETKKPETTSNDEVAPDYNSTVSTTMTSDDRLNPEKSASKTADITRKMNNTIPSTTIDDGNNSSTYSNLVMNKQLEHVINTSDKIRFFYFKVDDNGNPVFANQSGIDFNYVNNPESLKDGSEVEFKLTPLSEEQQKHIEIFVNSEKERIAKARKEGVIISKDDNDGFGDITKAIGIYSNDKLIGFAQLPKMYNHKSESAKAQEFTRDEIIAQRKLILDKLTKGEKVTTTIQTKGKGNYFSRSKKGNPDIKNQDGTNITPEVRTIDQIEGQSVYGYYKTTDNNGTWVIPDFSTKADTVKALGEMRKQLSDIGGYNGQVALMVKTANGTWSPIPVFTNTLSEGLQNDLWNKLLENRNNEAKTVIAAINEITYGSIDESSPLRIFPIGEDTMIQIGAAGPYKLSDISKNEAELKEEIKDLKTNLVANKINSKEYQDRLAKEKGIVTNVTTVNGDYFLQPFLAFNPINQEEVTKEVKEEPKKTTTLNLTDDSLKNLGLNPTGYISTLDTAIRSNDIIVAGKSYTIDDKGQIRNNIGTIIKTQGIRDAVLKQEAIVNNFYVDVAGHKVLAILSNKNGVSKRELKIVSLQSNREITNKEQKDELAKNNPEIGEFIKKYCI